MKKNTIYYSAFFLVVFLMFVLLITSIFFLTGLHIIYLTIILPLIASCFIIIFYNEKRNIKTKVFGIVLGIFIIVIFSLISGHYYDFSYDGNWYHKDAVGALKNGWNPVYQNYSDFYKAQGTRDGILETGLWQTHYAKGIWIISANFYYLFHDIEMAKIFNLLICYISIVFSYFFIRCFSNKKVLSIFLALCFSISPIVLIQMFTYYNDGALYNSILLSVLAFILIIKNRNDKDIYLYLFSFLIIAYNVKFTGLCYTGFILFFLYAGYFFINRNNLNSVKKTSVFLGITFAISIFIVGFNPYITNIISNKNPFYPLMGHNKVDIMTHVSPKYFENKNRFETLVISLASETDNINRASKNDPKFKVPFSIKENELKTLQFCDIRISGFGVWFFPLLVISSLVLLYYLIYMYKNDKNNFVILCALLLPIIGLCSIIKESWWARYTPYLYFLPCIAFFLLLIYSKKVYSKIIFGIMSFILVVNLTIYQMYSFKTNYQKTLYTNKVLENYNHPKKTINMIKTKELFIGDLYNLEDRNIKYKFVSNNNRIIIDRIYGSVPYMKEQVK